MLTAIPTVTTKEITVEYTQEEMRRELNCFAIKNIISSIQKKTVMQYMSGGETINHIENTGK